ncbi:MAG: TadE/TadG family type IV pilus assembly protein [Pseudomonadota bacterium]
MQGTFRTKTQTGVAAIEFALVLLLFLSLLYGIATFGMVFYTQQAVSRAAEDGARAISLLGSTALVANDPQIQGVVRNSLAASLIAPPGVDYDTAAERKTWVSNAQNVSVTTTDNACGSSGPSCVNVTVQYQYSRNSILPASSLINWTLPTTLTASAFASK